MSDLFWPVCSKRKCIFTLNERKLRGIIAYRQVYDQRFIYLRRVSAIVQHKTRAVHSDAFIASNDAATLYTKGALHVFPACGAKTHNWTETQLLLFSRHVEKFISMHKALALYV